MVFGWYCFGCGVQYFGIGENEEGMSSLLADFSMVSFPLASNNYRCWVDYLTYYDDEAEELAADIPVVSLLFPTSLFYWTYPDLS